LRETAYRSIICRSNSGDPTSRRSSRPSARPSTQRSAIRSPPTGSSTWGRRSPPRLGRPRHNQTQSRASRRRPTGSGATSPSCKPQYRPHSPRPSANRTMAGQSWRLSPRVCRSRAARSRRGGPRRRPSTRPQRSLSRTQGTHRARRPLGPRGQHAFLSFFGRADDASHFYFVRTDHTTA
jgi:hypothetical protein